MKSTIQVLSSHDWERITDDQGRSYYSQKLTIGGEQVELCVEPQITPGLFLFALYDKDQESLIEKIPCKPLVKGVDSAVA